ncbi:hypothetical protein DCC82_17225, partial [Geobacillus sp. LYN3]
GFLDTRQQRSRCKAVALFSFEGAFHSFNCFASASSSRFGEVGFLDARQQRSRFKAVALFSFEGTCLCSLQSIRFAPASTSGFKEAGFLGARLQGSILK